MTEVEEFQRAARIVREGSAQPWPADMIAYPPAWIAFMGPEAGEALADWLLGAGRDAEMIGPDVRALAFARRINQSAR